MQKVEEACKLVFALVACAQELMQPCIEYLLKNKCKHSGKHCERVIRMVFVEEGLKSEVGNAIGW